MAVDFLCVVSTRKKGGRLLPDLKIKRKEKENTSKANWSEDVFFFFFGRVKAGKN